MTISQSTGREFTVGKIVAMSYRRAGLLNSQVEPRDHQYSAGKDELETILDNLAAKGTYAHAVTFELVPFTVGVTEYVLDSSTQDVVGDAMLIPAGQDTSAADGETILRQIRREQWHVLGGKSALGRPSVFYTKRVANTPSVVVWPRPAEADTGRFQVHRKLADVDLTTVTLDLQNYWNKYLIAELAATLASNHSLPVPTIQRLKGEAREAFLEANRQANQRPSIQGHVAHRSRR